MAYRAFLWDMNKGLRRETICAVSHIDPKITLQDGVRARTVHVNLDDGDTRVFYINISKPFPPESRKIRLTAYGRHIVRWEELP